MLALAVAGLYAAVAHAQYGIVDGDGDGVDDNRDRCLYTRARAPVDASGCSRQTDQDNDGVADGGDDCPYSPAGAQVDNRGCAIDEDFDGIANGLDACGGSELGVWVDLRGCAGGQVAKALPPKLRSGPPTIVAAAPAPPPRPKLPTVAAAAVPAPVAPTRALTPPVPASRPVPVPVPAAPLPSRPAWMPPPPAAIGPTVAAAPAPAQAPAVTADAPAPLAVISVNPSALLSVSFTAGSNKLGASGFNRMQQALPAMRQALRQRHAVLLVEAYADAETDGDAADQVARSRANQLRRLLVDQGIDPRRIQSVGHPASEAGVELRRAEVTLELQ